MRKKGKKPVHLHFATLFSVQVLLNFSFTCGFIVKEVCYYVVQYYKPDNTNLNGKKNCHQLAAAAAHIG